MNKKKIIIFLIMVLSFLMGNLTMEYIRDLYLDKGEPTDQYRFVIYNKRTGETHTSDIMNYSEMVENRFIINGTANKNEYVWEKYMEKNTDWTGRFVYSTFEYKDSFGFEYACKFDWDIEVQRAYI